jgi:hypothetical protein
MFLSFDVVWMGDNDDEKDTRKIIFVNPRRENITILNPDAEQKNCIVESQNFEYVKNLMISRVILRLRNHPEHGRTFRKLLEEKNEPHRDTCCSVQ